MTHLVRCWGVEVTTQQVPGKPAVAGIGALAVAFGPADTVLAQQAHRPVHAPPSDSLDHTIGVDGRPAAGQ